MLALFIELKKLFPSIMPVFLHRQGYPGRDLINCPLLKEYNLPIELFFTKDVDQILKSTLCGFEGYVNFAQNVATIYNQYISNLSKSKK